MATSGFRPGIYVCKDAEIVDFAAPHGVFAASGCARRSATPGCTSSSTPCRSRPC